MAKTTSHKKRPGFTREVMAGKKEVTVSTGGGEPIPKGEKWTDEKRDEAQPRTEDGKFGTNASVGRKSKTPPHAWRGTYEKGHPLNPEGQHLTEKEKKRIWNEEVKETPDVGKNVVQHYAEPIHGEAGGRIKRGTKFAINGAIFIAAIDMSLEDFQNALRSYWEDGKGEGHLGSNEEAFIRKAGARSRNEEAALARSEESGRIEVVTTEKNKREIASLRAKTIKEKAKAAAKAYKERLEKGYPEFDTSTFVEKRSLERTGEEGEKHYIPDSEHDDEHVAEVLNSGNMDAISKLLDTPRFMDGEKFTLREALGKAKASVEDLASGDLKLSDIKAILRGE